MSDVLPEALAAYLIDRDNQHANDVADVLASLTDRERGILHDAAVMGYVQGLMRNREDGVPKDSQTMALVIDACLAHPDLYPTVNAGPPPRTNAHQWAVETRWHNGDWTRYGALYDTAEDAHEQFLRDVNGPGAHAFRLVHATTTYTVEALHDPDDDAEAPR